MVKRTEGAQGRLLPSDLRELGVLRRRRVCTKCDHKFYTIELLEDEFEILRQLLDKKEVRSEPV